MINPDDKLNRIEKQYPGIIEVIWYLSNNIRRLNKELIYSSLGNRTSLEQFARIEQFPLSGLIDYLYISTGNLHELSHEAAKHGTSDAPCMSLKDKFLEALHEENIMEVDVREDIISGKDPIDKIKDAVSKLKGDNAVRLINIFEPVPLYYALAKKGISYWSEYKDNCWRIYFYRQSSST